jgi:hypothetical protein
MKKIIIAFLCFLAVNVKAQQYVSNSVTGTIVTQNLVATGTATAGSAVVINCDALTQSISFQVSGVYTTGAGITFGLVVQASIDGVNWFTIEKFAQIATATGSATPIKLWRSNVPSAATGLYLIKNEGFKFVRICCTAGAVTGTATITLNNSNATFPNDVEYARFKVVSTGGVPITASVNGCISLRGSNVAYVRVLKMEFLNDYVAFLNLGTTLGVGQLVWNRLSVFTGGTALTLNGTRKSDPNLFTPTATAFGGSTNATQTVVENIAKAGFSQRHLTATGNYSPTFISYGYDNTKPLYVLRSNAEYVGMDYVQGTTFGASTAPHITIEWEEY